jgi:hypothetical protein
MTHKLEGHKATRWDSLLLMGFLVMPPIPRVHERFVVPQALLVYFGGLFFVYVQQ